MLWNMTPRILVNRC